MEGTRAVEPIPVAEATQAPTVNGQSRLPEPAAPAEARPAPTLESLIEAIGPIARAYFDAQRETQRRDLAFEAKVLRVEAGRDRALLVTVGTIAIVTLGLAGFLFYLGRDGVAMDFVKLLVAIGGAGAGGFGLAMRRRRADSDDE